MSTNKACWKDYGQAFLNSDEWNAAMSCPMTRMKDITVARTADCITSIASSCKISLRRSRPQRTGMYVTRQWNPTAVTTDTVPGHNEGISWSPWSNTIIAVGVTSAALCVLWNVWWALTDGFSIYPPQSISSTRKSIGKGMLISRKSSMGARNNKRKYEIKHFSSSQFG